MSCEGVNKKNSGALVALRAGEESLERGELRRFVASFMKLLALGAVAPVLWLTPASRRSATPRAPWACSSSRQSAVSMRARH